MLIAGLLINSVNSKWVQCVLISALRWCGSMKRSLRRRLGWPPIQLHGTLVKLTMQNWTWVNERGRAIGNRQSADEQGARSSKLKHTKEKLSIIRAQTPAYGVQSTLLSACNHTHTATASNNVHANPYLPSTHSQRTPEHTMPKILGDTHAHTHTLCF